MFVLNMFCCVLWNGRPETSRGLQTGEKIDSVRRWCTLRLRYQLQKKTMKLTHERSRYHLLHTESRYAAFRGKIPDFYQAL